MFLTFRRLIVIIGCLLYAGACAALAAHGGQEAAWALWVAVIAHLLFGIEAILQCFSSNELRRVLDQIRTELEAKYANERRERVKLEQRVTDLGIELAELRKVAREPA